VEGKDGRTEKPTPKRLKKSRSEGQIGRSPDLPLWLGVLLATYLVPWLMSRGLAAGDEMMGQIREVGYEPSSERMMSSIGSAMWRAFMMVLPVGIAMALLGIVVNAVQLRGVPFATKALKPNFKRLNPAKGLKNMFSMTKLVDLAKQLIKLVVVGAVSWSVGRDLFDDIMQSNGMNLWQVVEMVGHRSLQLVRTVALASFIVALADYGYQRRTVLKGLMMNKQEVKDEGKQQEGNPETKARIKSRQAQMSRQRMLTSVASANVVIVNPVHVAVALRYVPGRGAPRVVAKGRELIAEKIREKAEASGVPIVESVPLARALYAACDLEDEIPVEMYEGVARVLAFVHRIAGRQPLGGPVHQLV
jgi:flagellar biosynthesis protein FlhB